MCSRAPPSRDTFPPLQATEPSQATDLPLGCGLGRMMVRAGPVGGPGSSGVSGGTGSAADSRLLRRASLQRHTPQRCRVARHPPDDVPDRKIDHAPAVKIYLFIVLIILRW